MTPPALTFRHRLPGLLADGIEWVDIPPLAVLTGTNGAGKSEILRAMRTAPHVHPLGPGHRDARAIEAHKASKDAAARHPTSHFDVVFVPPFGNPSQPDSSFDADLPRLLKLVGDVFWKAHEDHVNQHGRSVPHAADAPWALANRLIESSGLPYRLTTPMGQAIGTGRTFALELINGSRKCAPAELSPGETAILRLSLWLYRASVKRGKPVLLLLDEPDAHLHTSLVQHLLQSLDELVQGGVRVVMTTHRPDTLVLAPQGSLFEVFGVPPAVRPVAPAAAIARLSANLFSAAPQTRCVLVEDDADAIFFRRMRNIHLEVSQNQREPTLVFQRAGLGTASSREKQGGGRNAVTDWVSKLSSANLSPFVQGIIDLDRGNSGAPGVHVLSRYSYENYLLDPLVVFAALLRQERAGVAEVLVRLSLPIGVGQERNISKLPEGDQTIISKWILDQVEAVIELEESERAPVPVPFVNGPTLAYPTWLLRRKGHELQGHFYRVFNTDLKELHLALEAVHMVPSDIADIFTAIATAVPS